jgi:hypothetical protein
MIGCSLDRLDFKARDHAAKYVRHGGTTVGLKERATRDKRHQ